MTNVLRLLVKIKIVNKPFASTYIIPFYLSALHLIKLLLAMIIAFIDRAVHFTKKTMKYQNWKKLARLARKKSKFVLDLCR
jgi:hypothetical protein